jgi:hypothetical protein
MCWFADNAESRFKVAAYNIINVSNMEELYSSTLSQLSRLKSYRHTHGEAVNDFDLQRDSNDLSIRILSPFFDAVSLADLLKISKVIPLSTAAAVMGVMITLLIDSAKHDINHGSMYDMM